MVRNRIGHPGSNPDETVCVSLRYNIIEKGMNQYVPASYEWIVGQPGFLREKVDHGSHPTRGGGVG